MVRQGIPFVIEIKSAIHVGRAPLVVGEYLFTQRHIPGSVLRGALAEMLINRYGLGPGPGSEFNRLFEGPEALRFEPAYPATTLEWGHPFPLTARWCKTHGGFPRPDTDPAEQKHYHGAFDILVSQVVFEEQLAAGPVPFIEKPLCPHCWEGVEPAQGVYTWDADENHPGVASDVRLMRHTHTAINRARGVAEDRMLYTVETMEPGTLLRGCVWVEASQVERVREALSEISRLGRGVRRGRGQVVVEPLPQESDDGGILARIKALNQLIEEERVLYARLAGRAAPPADGVYFTLDLLSPAIFEDGATATLEPEELGLPFEADLVRRFVAPEAVGGWWRSVGLPHPTALAAKAGSVFLYQAPPSVDLKDLSQKLGALRARGIGHRRERGYGAVLPCAPFHLWTAEKETTR